VKVRPLGVCLSVWVSSRAPGAGPFGL